jgi:hypothetical protein
MEETTKDLVSLLFQLFPGFVAAWIVYGLTSYPKPSQFERVAQALVFSFLIKVLLIPEEWVLLGLGKFVQFADWDSSAEMVAATATAVAFGLLVSYFMNSDTVYALGRRLGFTRRTAFPSEWYGALNRSPAYVVLHLGDERRIVGWPIQWPSDPKIGHFELADAAWISKEPENKEIPLTGVKSILIASRNVLIVEILKPLEELQNNGAETG